jgi:CPA2 family monovalent cation:H+ antiporter-2
LSPLAVESGVPLLLVELGALFLVLALLARLAAHTAFSPIPLYLLAGLGLGLALPSQVDQTTTDVITQIAVILLLFMLGLEFSAGEIVESLREHLPSGVLDGVLNFLPGFAAGMLLGWSPLSSLLLGGVTYISSSSITAKVLDDLDRLGNLETPAILSILVIEDMAMALYLPLVVALLAGSSLLLGVGTTLAAVAALVAALYVSLRFGHLISRRLSHPSDEVVLLTVVALLLIVGGAAELLRVSAAVGAFLVGIALSGALRDRSRTLLAPIRDLMAAAFFVLFALEVDLGAVPEVAAAAAALWAVTTATKVATGMWAARTGTALVGRLRAGTALVARGEFSIVIAGLAVGSGEERLLAPLAATYVLLTAVTGPLLTRVAEPLGRAVVRRRRAA